MSGDRRGRTEETVDGFAIYIYIYIIYFMNKERNGKNICSFLS